MIHNSKSGQLLMEVLVAIAAVALVASLATQLILTGMRGNKISSETNVALGFSEESFEAVRSIAAEKWQDIFNLEKYGQNYYPQIQSGKWVVATGTESIVINELDYSRSFIVQNVCRDVSTRIITGFADSDGTATTCFTSGGVFDPSTQAITVSILWPDADAVSATEYITRWQNKICVQSSWSSQSSGTSTCPGTIYGTKSNITTGSNLQLCEGGC